MRFDALAAVLLIPVFAAALLAIACEDPKRAAPSPAAPTASPIMQAMRRLAELDRQTIVVDKAAIASGGEPVVVGVNARVDFHFAGVARAHGDVARASGDVHLHGPVYCESLVEMAVSGRVRGGHCSQNGKREGRAREVQMFRRLHNRIHPFSNFNGPVYGTQIDR